MNLTVPEGLKPLAVWDTDDPDWLTTDVFERSAWADRHVGRACHTHRIDFFLIDAPFAVVHRFAVNEDGRPFLDVETGEAAEDEPAIVPLAELPPAELL